MVETRMTRPSGTDCFRFVRSIREDPSIRVIRILSGTSNKNIDRFGMMLANKMQAIQKRHVDEVSDLFYC